MGRIIACDGRSMSEIEFQDMQVVGGLNLISVLCPNESLEHYPMTRDALMPLRALAYEVIEQTSSPVTVEEKAAREHATELVDKLNMLDRKYNGH